MQGVGRPRQRAPHGAPLHHEHHRPEQTTLYRLVQRHAPSFIAHTEANTGSDLSRFTTDEFDAFLECDILTQGLLGLRCGEGGDDRPAPVSRFQSAIRQRWWISDRAMYKEHDGKDVELSPSQGPFVEAAMSLSEYDESRFARAVIAIFGAPAAAVFLLWLAAYPVFFLHERCAGGLIARALCDSEWRRVVEIGLVLVGLGCATLAFILFAALVFPVTHLRVALLAALFALAYGMYFALTSGLGMLPFWVALVASGLAVFIVRSHVIAESIGSSAPNRWHPAKYLFYLLVAASVARDLNTLFASGSGWECARSSAVSMMWLVGLLCLYDTYMARFGPSKFMRKYFEEIKESLYGAAGLGLVLAAAFFRASLSVAHGVDIAMFGVPFLLKAGWDAWSLRHMKIAGLAMPKSVTTLLIAFVALALVICIWFIRVVTTEEVHGAESVWLQISICLASYYVFYFASLLRFYFKEQHVEPSPALLDLMADFFPFSPVPHETRSAAELFNAQVATAKRAMRKEKERRREKKNKH